VAPDGTAFLAMELLDGWDLKELIAREGPLTTDRLVSLMAQALAGLSAAHEKGIVHRDMKPANVFVVRQGDKDFVKLLDFGISKMHAAGEQHGLTMTGVAMGTPAYMAPEQFFDARNVDGRADLYSVAAMLYELLGRRLPFDADSYADLIVKVRTETPTPLASLVPQLPASLCAAIDRGLSRDKAARWSTAQEFSAAIGAVPVPALPVSAAVQRVTPAAAAFGSNGPLAQSMFEKTATPTPAAQLARETGWVAPPTTQPPVAPPTPQGLPPPQTPQVLPPPQAPQAQPLQVRPLAQPPPAQKSSAGKIVLISAGVFVGLMFLCCFLSAIGNAMQQHH
jgi:serine/threonine-protein kinase